MCFYLNVKLLRAGVLLPAALLLSAAPRTETALPPRVVESYGKLPLSFEANRGQTDPRVKFLSRGQGYTLFLTSDASAVLSLRGEESNAVLRMNLRGANARASVTGADTLPGKSNYFIGNDPGRWWTNVPTFGAVKYSAVYPGIDLVYHGNQRLLEYDFVVAPGADPRAIDINFQGARKISVNRDGALVIGVGSSEVIEHAPVVYQDIAGQRQTVAGSYVLRGKGRVGFSVAEYDRSQPLVIDPALVYSTYVGGTGFEEAFGIAVDTSGNAYVTGVTSSADFPISAGAYQTTEKGSSDAFVLKLNAVGSTLVYSTYLGGSNTDIGVSIAVDASGSAYVTGQTESNFDFPTTPGAFQTAVACCMFYTFHTFVSKLDATGSGLVYSTYLSGNADEYGDGVAVDGSGNAYVVGWTSSSDFPTTPGAFQTIYGGNSDVFVTKLNATGSALQYSTYLGGSDVDRGNSFWNNGIAVDAAGNAYVTGFTYSSDFPTTPGALQTTLGGPFGDAFVTKLNAAGSALLYSTHLGGSGGAMGYDIAVDTLGNAYITGGAGSGFPTTPGAYETSLIGGNSGAFVSKLNAQGSALVYSTYLGGGYVSAQASGIAVDAFHNAYVTGLAAGFGFPTTPGAFQTGFGGTWDAFVSEFDASGANLLYSTYLGGSQMDYGTRVAVDRSSNVYVIGTTYSSGFPTTPGALQTRFGGDRDAFVTKLNLGSAVAPPATTADLSGPLGNNAWYTGTVTVTLIATPGSSPVSSIYYSADSSPYQIYGVPFSISGDGTHQLQYYSVDTVGDQETPHGQTIKIDGTKPVSRVGALPATATSPNFKVQWSGSDATSGVANYTIYVSDNGGPFAPWLSGVTSTQAYYTGSLLQTYAFYSIATDNAGNVESKTAAEATTHVPQMPGDVNGDGKINCADVALVKTSFGKRTGQTGFNPSADVNGDGVVDIRDLSLVSQKLIPGTKCP